MIRLPFEGLIIAGDERYHTDIDRRRIIRGAQNRYCLSLHPISVRTELVREGAYYILWTKANYVQDMGMIANSTRSDRERSIFSQQKE